MKPTVRPLNLRISGIASTVGGPITMDDWAEMMQIPLREGAGSLAGHEVSRILGIRTKSWDRGLFADPGCVLETAERALRGAAVAANDIDTVLVVTCTPYELMLDQDSFRLLGDLGVPDDVPPIQLGAGCGGMARALSVLAGMRTNNALVVAYTLASPNCEDARGQANPIYVNNHRHPLGKIIWASPATFSDGVAAVVLSRTAEQTGMVFYSRDSWGFGGGPPFDGQVVYFPGGGALQPMGFAGTVENCAFGLATEEIRDYYSRGMMLNHQRLLEVDEQYLKNISRLYTHQASPGLVESFHEAIGVSEDLAPRHASTLGNLVSPCTMKMLDDDVASGQVLAGEQICVSVVGAGPERGAFILPVTARP